MVEYNTILGKVVLWLKDSTLFLRFSLWPKHLMLYLYVYRACFSLRRSKTRQPCIVPCVLKSNSCRSQTPTRGGVPLSKKDSWEELALCLLLLAAHCQNEEEKRQTESCKLSLYYSGPNEIHLPCCQMIYKRCNFSILWISGLVRSLSLYKLLCLVNLFVLFNKKAL